METKKQSLIYSVVKFLVTWFLWRKKCRFLNNNGWHFYNKRWFSPYPDYNVGMSVDKAIELENRNIRKRLNYRSLYTTKDSKPYA